VETSGCARRPRSAQLPAVTSPDRAAAPTSSSCATSGPAPMPSPSARKHSAIGRISSAPPTTSAGHWGRPCISSGRSRGDAASPSRLSTPSLVAWTSTRRSSTPRSSRRSSSRGAQDRARGTRLKQHVAAGALECHGASLLCLGGRSSASPVPARSETRQPLRNQRARLGETHAPVGFVGAIWSVPAGGLSDGRRRSRQARCPPLPVRSTSFSCIAACRA